MSRPTSTHRIDALPPTPGRGRVVICAEGAARSRVAPHVREL
jgi:hypothetical protein